MYKKLVPLTYAQHQHLKLNPLVDFDFASGMHLAALTVHEFMRAAAIYPIVFIPDGDTYKPVALTGLQPQENVFVNSDGQWQASYIPASIRRYPFALVKTPTDGEYSIYLDAESTNLKVSEGEAIFAAEDEFSEPFTKLTEMLKEHQVSDVLTQDFCQRLQQLGLLAPLKIGYQIGDQGHNLEGCYVINEQAFNELAEVDFAQFKERGYLPAIYAQGISMGQVERLVALKQQQSSAPKPAIH